MFFVLAAASALATAAPSECAVSPPIPDPPSGLKIEIAFGAGRPTILEEVGETEDGATRFTTRPVFDAEAAWVKEFSPEKQEKMRQAMESAAKTAAESFHGVFPARTEFSNGKPVSLNKYDRHPGDAMEGLAVGEQVTLTVAVARFKKDGAADVATNARAATTFLGCFTENVAGADEKLLKFEIASTAAGVIAETGEPRRTLVAISQRLGWRVYEFPLDTSGIRAVRFSY